uniref:ATP synthase F0 subunit 8 n=1 Tax=Haemaphysalis danieli TaxID=2204308 RepID=A0A976MZC2_9ACAR|nr:ATP synthase F0 subunit 8 [Haemaphysalis danieli]UNO54030.1 ATP synthase F0 subunit 8 [Haemaphysalis danieli]
MPQLFPMNWMLISMMILIIMIFIMINIYFLSNKMFFFKKNKNIMFKYWMFKW